MKIGVVGAGYVGLVTAAVFADLGNEVINQDIDTNKIQMLKKGEMPFFEPGLEEMVLRNVREKRLSFTESIEELVDFSEIIFIAVGTPSRDNGETDLQYVVDVAQSIGTYMKSYKVIVNKSTVPVGTGELVKRIIQEHQTHEVPFDVVSNPEFLREGSALFDALHPDRIVIGAPNQQVALKVMELYATLGAPIIVTDVASAEIIKYASNAFLAMKISFINSIADLCEATGADIVQVAKAVGLDHRIGPHFLQAGLGYGGSCFPKDVKSLIHTAREYGADASLFEAADRINEHRVHRFVQVMKSRLKTLKGKTIAVLGLSFKPDTDDLRESRAIRLISLLVREGAHVRAYDPVSMKKARDMLPDIKSIVFVESPYEAVRGADAMVIATDWREFKQIDLKRVKALMRKPYVFDGRNIYNPDWVKRAGLEYYGVGRTKVSIKSLHPQE